MLTAFEPATRQATPPPAPDAVRLVVPSRAGVRTTVHEVVPAPREPEELLPGPHIVLATDEGWPCLVTRREGGATALYTFFVWACVVEVRSGTVPFEALFPLLRAARPVLARHGCLLEALGAPSPAGVRPLAPSAEIDFTGWTRRDRRDGPELVADDGQARIEIREGCPPSRRAARAAALRRARAAGAESHAFTTAAGEHGAWVTLRGETEEHVAWLVGETADTELEAAATPARAADTRLLLGRILNEYTFGLGPDRVRRFLYAPPAGWQGLGRGLHSDWFPPGFPARRARITVQPAFPVAELSRHAGLDRCLRGPMHEAELRAQGVEPVGGPDLAGKLVHKAAPGRLVDEVMLRDDRYYYPFRLDCEPGCAAEARAVFRAVWASAVPLARPARAAAGDIFNSWTD